MAGARLLLVDDERELVRALTTNLGAHGFDVSTAGSGAEALERWAVRHPDVVLLDLGLPDIDGMEVLRRMRAEAPTPVIILSARDQERQKVAALNAGADDYLTKPFGMDELLARVRVALRHSAGQSGGGEASIAIGRLQIDLERRRLSRDGEEIHLTPTEFELLRALVKQHGRVVTRSRLISAVWGTGYADAAHTLHVHMASLRRKVEEDPTNPRVVRTEAGVGYRLALDEPS